MTKQRFPLHGWLILDKPLGLSSAQAVGAVKRILRPEKIGHAGTLDPLASGILPLALGEATKTVGYMMDAGKSYDFTVQWGEERTTDDREGQITQTSGKRPSREEIEGILPEFQGVIEQAPPSFSAIKVDGERAYKMAREGEAVQLAARKVRVDELVIVNQPDDSHTAFRLVCGKGTYVRSLARDMGRRLGCFGHVSALRRTRVGNFPENAAISLDNLEKLVHSAALHGEVILHGAQRLAALSGAAPACFARESRFVGAACVAPGGEAPERNKILLPVESALDDIPALIADSANAAKLRLGQAIFASPKFVEGKTVAVMHQGKLLALASRAGEWLKPVRVFNY